MIDWRRVASVSLHPCCHRRIPSRCSLRVWRLRRIAAWLSAHRATLRSR